MESKIRIKMGEVEVEYEGSESFLKRELSAILDAVSRLHDAKGTKAGSGVSGASRGGKATIGTTASVAAKLGSKSGTDLMLAAAAKLVIGDGLAEFTSKQLHDEMKSATGYYKKSYTNNFTNYLGTLTKSQQLHEVSKGAFSLSQSVKTGLEKKLA